MDKQQFRSSIAAGPARIALAYAIVSMLWIAASDAILERLGVVHIALVQTLKGAFFVAVTGCLLYLMVNRLVRRAQRVEKLREESDRLYRALIESTTEGVCRIGSDDRITFHNRQFATMLGYDSAVGMPMEHVVPPAARPLIRQKLAERRQGKPDRYDINLLTSDGREMPAMVSASPLFDENGKYVASFAVVIDISERKRLEEELRHSQKLDAVGRFAGGIAHDFNNLLGVIIGYASLLEKSLPRNSQGRNSAAEILNASNRATVLIRQLLAFSRKEVAVPELLDLCATVKDFSSVLPRVIGEDIKLVVSCAAQPLPVRVGTGHIEQIMMNLAANARDAMPNGGILRVETSQSAVEEKTAAAHSAKPGWYARLRVADSGTGIDANIKNRIFEPFFTTKPAGHGTGLGLSTVYGIVRQNGGFIEVESELGVGTAFDIYFPVLDSDVPAAEPRQEAAPGDVSGSETVLLVEDESGLRTLTKMILESHGYTVLEAGNADEALNISRTSGCIDLLLTDMVMPGLSGAELADLVRRERPSTKIAFMSGYAEPAQLQTVPSSYVIEKPVTPENLLIRLRTILNGDFKGGAGSRQLTP